MTSTAPAPVVRDRLVATFVLAAILHGLLILGITFKGVTQALDSSPGIEVLLVSDELPAADRNDSAAYLSQRTQRGSGNTQDMTAARNVGAPVVQPPTLAPENAGNAGEALVSTSSPLASAAPGTANAVLEDPPLILEERLPGADSAMDGGPPQLRGPDREGIWLAADTRAATLAPYLAAWRSKVERIGTLNYPAAAQHMSTPSSPIVEVAIAANGTLKAATIRRSSGYPDLDQAALSILRLASPFDPFPPDLARERPVLRFAYEWQFVGGRVAGSLSVVP